MAAEGQDLFLRLVSQQSADLRQDLGVGKVHLGDGVVRAFGHAAAAAVALGCDHLRRLTLSQP